MDDAMAFPVAANINRTVNEESFPTMIE